MKTLSILALAFTALLSSPTSQAQDVLSYDGIATVYALKAAASPQPAFQLKHSGSPFASKDACETTMVEALPALAEAIHQKYNIDEGVDFSVEAKCEPSGTPA